MVVGSAGRERAGLASGILNAARQSGGALGVALLGALLVSSQRGGHGVAMHVPMAVAAVGYLITVSLTLIIGSGDECGKSDHGVAAVVRR